MLWEEIMLIAHHTHIDPAAVQILNQLVEKSQSLVVVSSSWRIMYSVDELNSMLKDRGAIFNIIAATPKYPEYTSGWGGHSIAPRGVEIQAYLDSLDEQPESFVILDDVNNMLYLTKYLVLTDDYHGLTEKDVVEALRILE